MEKCGEKIGLPKPPCSSRNRKRVQEKRQEQIKMPETQAYA